MTLNWVGLERSAPDGKTRHFQRHSIGYKLNWVVGNTLQYDSLALQWIHEFTYAYSKYVQVPSFKLSMDIYIHTDETQQKWIQIYMIN